MRHEILMFLYEECQNIQDKWALVHETEVKISENRVFWEPNITNKPK